MQEKMSKSEQSLRADTYKILQTKLAIPQPRSMWVPRTGLLARFDQEIDGKLTLISAPPGFGKTTLVSQWIAVRSKQTGAPLIAWVSLDIGDNDPVRFWRYVIAACQSFESSAGASALEMLNRAQKPAYEAALTSLLNDLTGLSGKHALVLEDYHVIQTQQIHETVTYLLDHLPANLHVIITTRRSPPLPLPRLRVRNELLELDARDLRFSLEEIGEFLSQTVHTPLQTETIARLEARTEGWAAGLRLIALALQGKKDSDEIEHSIENLSGSHKHVLEYLAAEVLNAQPEPIQDFILRTSVLNCLTGSLCDALTGREDGTEMLEQIEKANLFLEPLDAAHNWYRYHSLFAEAMQQEALARFGNETVRRLYEQASCWFEEHGKLGDAVEAALTGQLFPRAATLIERIVQESPDFASEKYTLRRWLDVFPQQQLHESAPLCFLYANAILYTSDRYATETRTLLRTPLRVAERLWRAEGKLEMVGRVVAFRSLVDWWQGDAAASFAGVKEALGLLAIHDAEWRGTCQLGLGVEALLAGEIAPARRYFVEARELLEAAGNSYGVLAAVQLLGIMCLRQGELHQASELFQEVLKEAGEELSDRAQALAGLAELAYEWNDLERARRLASEALDISRQVQEHDALVNSSLTLARVLHAQGETAQAQQVVQSLITQSRGSLLAGDVELGQAWMAYVKGDLVTAERWSFTWNQDSSMPVLVQERRALMAARLQIARGEVETALSQLETWLAKARQQGRVPSEIEILMLQALARFTHHDQTLARQSLLQALRLAQPEGYMRIFLDEGEQLAVLLKDVLPEVQEESQAGLVRALLVVFTQKQGAATSPASGDLLPLEALSEQEKRVLRLLAVGRTYREIAEELVVSLNTVKTQLKSIYRKLGVSKRDEASEVARHLKMNW